MKLTMTQIEDLLEAVDQIEQAKRLIQRALSQYVESSDLSDKLDDIIIEIDRIGTEVELTV